MTFEEMDLSEMPPHFAFSKIVEQQFYLWERYQPTTIEADIPFDQDWWKYVHWMPKIKKDFYNIAISSPDMERDLQLKAKSLGMDYWFFTSHYRHFIKRLNWMRKQGVTHIGEAKV